MNDKRQVGYIVFGVLSADEIRKMSVCEVNDPKKVGYGTVYDPRMGPTDSHADCETCKQNDEDCTGHFGHIELNVPIVHSLYYKRVLQFLNCICSTCYRFLMVKDQLALTGILKYKNEARFAQILDKIAKVDICCHDNCGKDQPKFRFSVAEHTYYKVYIENKKKVSVEVTTEELYKVFDSVPDEDVVLMGFDPKLVHPRNYILTVIPVLPPCARPYVQADGKICDDDLTVQYIEIVKNNNSLREKDPDDKKPVLNENKREAAIRNLRFRIQTTWNNSKNKAKHATSNRPIKCIKKRLTGKDNQMRSNMSGKRCNRTGRTVIGPDPTLRVNEVGIPEEIAKILTVPVKVSTFNLDVMQDIVNSGKIDSLIKPDEKTVVSLKKFRKGTRLIHGDIIHRGKEKLVVQTGRDQEVKEGDRVERNGEFLKKLIPSNREYKITEGWTVNQPLYDGLFVAYGRQPSLWAGSMMGMKIVIKPGKTFRHNLAVCKAQNSDEHLDKSGFNKDLMSNLIDKQKITLSTSETGDLKRLLSPSRD